MLAVAVLGGAVPVFSAATNLTYADPGWHRVRKPFDSIGEVGDQGF
jgi:hypothetical protein